MAKKKRLPGELERKALRDAGELVFRKETSFRDQVGYQLTLLYNGDKVGLFDNPSEYKKSEVRSIYEDINFLDEFWLQKDNPDMFDGLVDDNLDYADSEYEKDEEL
jgi:hypothetical protein